MSTVFIGGSRYITSFSELVKKRLNNVVQEGHKVIVGDAVGADKAVQKFLSEASYQNVTVFCSGDSYRNNLGQWPTRHVQPPKSAKGFQLYAAKDREMARETDFGLMVWDGKSPGTLLNVLRLVRAGKKSVLIDVPNQKAITFKTETDWDSFLSGCSTELCGVLYERHQKNGAQSTRDNSDSKEG
jgi:hypothetical protein